MSTAFTSAAGCGQNFFDARIMGATASTDDLSNSAHGSGPGRAGSARPRAALLLLFAAAYFVAGGFGQGLPLIPGVAITFWPPAGIFVAALLCNPRRHWRWYVVAAGLAELACNEIWFHNPMPFALVYFAANALEALTAAWLVGRFVPRSFRIESPGQAAAFVGLAAGLAPVVGATVIATTDALIGKHAFSTAWTLVWLGDSTGLLVSTPIALAIAQAWGTRHRISRHRLVEAVGVAVLLVGVGALAFRDVLPTAYMTMPLVLWTAVRFQWHGAAVAVALVAITTAAFTALGAGEFAGTAEQLHAKVVMLQTFLGVTAVSALLAATLSQRLRQTQDALEAANLDLERRVEERTESLRASDTFNRSLMDGSADCVKVLGLDGHLVHMNAPGQCLMEIDDFGPLCGQQWSALWPAQAREDIERSLAAARAGDAYSFQAFCPTAKGTPRWWDVVVSPIRDAADGPVVRVLSVSRDITGRKQAEEALRESEARFRRVLRQSPAGIVETDATGCMTLVNERWCEMLGYSEAELLGKSVLDVTHSSSRTATAENVARLAAGGPDFQIDKNYWRKDGSQFPAQSNVTAVRSYTGEFLGLVSVVVDVSERVRADQELRERAGQLDLLARSAQRLLECHSLTSEVRHEIFGGIAELVGVGGFFHYRADNSERCLYLEASGGLSDEDRRVYDTLKFGELLCGRVAESGQRLIVEDLRHSTQPGSEPLRAAGAQSYAGFPLLDSRGDLVGTLAFVSSQQAHFRAGDVQMIETICAQVALMMERKQATEASREQKNFLDRITAVTPDVLYVLDIADYRFKWVSQQAANRMGYSEEEILAMGADFMPRVMHPDDLARMPAHFAELARAENGQTLEIEYRLHRPDGTWRWFRGRKTPFSRDAKGNVREIIGTSSDITERKRAEEAIARLAAIVESSHDAIASTDLQGTITSWNKGAETMFGYSAGETVGQSILFWLPPERRHEEHEIQAAIGKGQGLTHLETVRLCKDGSRVEVSVTVSPIRDAGGAIIGASKTARDITARKQAEAAQRAIQERMRLAAEATGVGIWEWNVLTHAMHWDAVMFGLYGIPPTPDGLVQYSDWSGAVLPEDLARQEEVLQEAVRTGGHSSREFRIRRAGDGDSRIVQSVEATRRNAHGQVEWVVGTNLDITDRKRVEEELRRLAAELSEADRRKDVFLATLAHELRNPLAPIRNGLQVMKLMRNNGEAVERARDMMDRQLSQLVRLVDDLLDASRINQGKVELRRERIDLKTVIAAAMETSRPAIEQADHELVVVMPDEPIFVNGDVTRLAQVVSNLLNNSAKYTHRGGHVRLTVGREDGMAVVSVKDDGIGIPPAMIGRVFDMFTQGDRTLEKTTGGLGIGLSLVKGLLEMHGGTIEANSGGQDMGSEFVARLPLEMAPDAEQDRPNRQTSEVVPSALCRILVVDDNVDAADSLGELLEMLGNEVRTANDGEAAIEVAAQFRPDVVLMDIGMPKLNGFEAARRIRQHTWSRGMMLVALTGWGHEHDRKKSADAGFDHHLVKPVEMDALVKLMSGRKRA